MRNRKIRASPLIQCHVNHASLKRGGACLNPVSSVRRHPFAPQNLKKGGGWAHSMRKVSQELTQQPIAPPPPINLQMGPGRCTPLYCAKHGQEAEQIQSEKWFGQGITQFAWAIPSDSDCLFSQ